MTHLIANESLLEGVPSQVESMSETDSISALVSKTHADSLHVRHQVLQKVISSETLWPGGGWGDTMWALSALYLNEKTEDANERLFKRANKFIEYTAKGNDLIFTPGEEVLEKSPWGYFGLSDYVRILCLFAENSKHFPGRLKKEVEIAMLEALWLYVSKENIMDHTSLDNLLVTLGTENHDLTTRPNFYLADFLFMNHQEFKDRVYKDGLKAKDHFEAYNHYFKNWAKKRIECGLWIEVGSDTYQKYSWPPLVNLAELSPDPVVRKQFEMLLDVAFIEEAQISVQGRRGGGRSRASYSLNSFESYKDLLYGSGPGCSHSKVLETSSYQAPVAAILLRFQEFPANEPFTIINRVLGESTGNRVFLADSALLNYAYRSPHYIIGSTIQNPSLSVLSEDGKVLRRYGAISAQKRWTGILFDDPEARQPVRRGIKHRDENEMCAIFTEIEMQKPGQSGRPEHSFWSFQHKNVVLLQRIQPNGKGPGMGSYKTGKVNIRFHGKSLVKIEKEGWIFASNGKAYAAVKFLDSEHEWDETGELASPRFFKMNKTDRILLHSGDILSDRSFTNFQNKILQNPLEINRDSVIYKSHSDGALLECFRYQFSKYNEFRLPRINGEEINLRPPWVYQSPYLNGIFGDSSPQVTVGAYTAIYDFDNSEVIQKGF